jgi:hypothetical protein
LVDLANTPKPRVLFVVGPIQGSVLNATPESEFITSQERNE